MESALLFFHCNPPFGNDVNTKGLTISARGQIGVFFLSLETHNLPAIVPLQGNHGEEIFFNEFVVLPFLVRPGREVGSSEKTSHDDTNQSNRL